MLARLALVRRLPSQPLLQPLPLNMCCRVRPWPLVLLLPVPSMGRPTSQPTGAASRSCERVSPRVLAPWGRHCLSCHMGVLAGALRCVFNVWRACQFRKPVSGFGFRVWSGGLPVPQAACLSLTSTRGLSA